MPVPFSLFIAALLCCGGVSGLLSGLFGIGGGILNVPLLDMLFQASGLPPDRALHMAAGTSVLTVVPTAFVALRNQLQRDAVDRVLVRRWGPALVLGALAGGVIANRLPATALSLLFGFFVLMLAGFMGLAPAGLYIRGKPPQGITSKPVALALGLLAGTLGIGGGALTVPVLVLCRMPVHRAIGTSAAITLMIAVPSSIIFMLGQAVSGMPPDDAALIGSFGNVNLLAFALLAPVAMLAAPYGVRLAHRLNAMKLRRSLSLLLAVIALKMIAAGW